MDPKPNKISATEASAALESVASFQRKTNEIIRPPIWLTGVIGITYGMITFSHAMMKHENEWGVGLIISMIVFCLALGFYFYTSKLLGIKPRVLPRGKAETLLDLSAGLFFIITIFASRHLVSSGMEWAAYAGAMLNGVGLAWLLHKYSAGVAEHG